QSRVTKTRDGYQVAGFIPAAAIRFWPRPGVNILADLCLFTYGETDYTKGYWHGTYGQANTWARARLGEDKKADKPRETVSAAPSAPKVVLPANTAQACLRVENWMPQETHGVGRASVAFDAGEILPNGKKGAIVLRNDGPEEEAQLMTRFDEMGKRPGLRVWLKGTGSGAKIELRVTGREGSTWRMILKDDFQGWQPVDVVLDRCQQTTEDFWNEVWEKYEIYRPLLNRLIVRFARPLSGIKVGLVEYLLK
ncbi:MAG: carbohydrate binding domain-containing protein, partial [Candidatus Ratteibacteria bacterium]